MGRVGGFLDFNRKEPGYRKVSERLRDYKPVEKQLPEAEIRAQAARCMDCGTPFCHGCGCPLANVVPEVNDYVYQGRWQEALDILLSTNNFPEFTGRLCPALCEPACVLGINDDPVTIRQIELVVIEKGFEKGYMRARPPHKRISRSVAVIGSGPAGLTVADDLNRAGCDIVVYERAQNAGGILRYGIPDFKLEKRIIDRRINLMRDEGVSFEYGVSIGDDISFRYLQDRYDAVCIAGGSRTPRDLDVPGRELYGIHFAMDFLVQQNMRLSGEDIDGMEEIDAAGRNVLILGGGDTGADCLGTALRQGARKVYQYEIMPRPPEERPGDQPWPAWPDIMRESSSHKEGGERRWGVSTKAFKGKEGHVVEASGVEVEWTGNEDGSTKMKELKDGKFSVKVDLVLLALGFVGPGRVPYLEDLGLELDERGNIKIDEHGMTSIEGVFAAGDLARGQSLIVRAICDGKHTARGILAWMGK